MISKIARIVVFITIITAVVYPYGAKPGSISGVVHDESSGKPLELVNVTLIRISDSSVVTGSTTDNKGRFMISGIDYGRYVLRFSMIGYLEKWSESCEISSMTNNLKLPEIVLAHSTVTLEEAWVTANKSLQNNSIDRKVYNVGQDIMSKAGTASELLQNIPSVQVDIDGSVSLRGTSNVMIMIDGKSSPLLASNSAAVLEQMPANSIERVEVITNPSAKFRPDGTGGIINIVLKKNSGSGLKGSATLNGGNQNRYNGNAGINYSFNGLSIFGNLGYRQDDRNRFLDEDRQEFYPASSLLYTGHSHSTARPVSRIGTIGLDYRFSKNDKTGLAGNFVNQDLTWMDKALKLYRNSAGVISEDYDRNRREAELRKQSDIEVYYRHEFDSEGHELKLDAKYSNSLEDENNYYVNKYRFPVQPNWFEDTKMKEKESQTQLSAGYSLPLSGQSKFECGYEGEYNKLDINMLAEYRDPVLGAYISDGGRSFHFILKEKVSAAYATFESGSGAFGYILGLRAEHSGVSSDLSGGNTVIDNSYFGFYPTVHLAYKVSDLSQWQLNYSRRVRRPEADEMNPFPEYQDPRNLRRGNPKLLPEYTHSIEFGYKTELGNLSFVPSLFYRYTYNRFTTITSIEHDTVLVTSYTNLSNDASAGLEIVCAGTFPKILSANFSLTGFYNKIDASNVGYSNDKSVLSWSGAVNCNFNFMANTMIQLNSNFRAARLTPQGKTKPVYVVNAGVKHDLFDDQLSLTLTVSDIFKSQKRENEIDTDVMKQTVINKRDSGVIYFGMTYYFGKPEKKGKEKSLQYENGI